MAGTLQRLFTFAQQNRPRVASLVYGSATAVALWAAFELRFEGTLATEQMAALRAALPWLVGLRIALAFAFRLTMGRWRFVGINDVARLTGAITAGSAIYFALSWGLGWLPLIPRSVILIEAVVNEYLVAAIWIGYRMTFERMRHARFPHVRKRILVVGAGEAGQALVREMHRTPSGMMPVGYVDDDALKHGARIHGIQVLGGVPDLHEIVERTQTDEILIAVPSAPPKQVRTIVEACETAGKAFSILPGVVGVLKGDAHLGQVREVQVEDLLGRDPIVMHLPEVRADVAGRTVLVTGAAGSIGSELSRQIALHSPAKLVLLDQAETPLFFTDLELRNEHPGIEVVPIIGDIADATVVESVFAAHDPDRVFHSAAYKHVPMMERNPLEAARNNVLGTWLVADAAGRHGTGKFVLVSTDKAVRPANVMGATKRMAELAVLELQRRYSGTAYGAVRFGNVLGSSGSVLPIFRKQLKAGRPLTVTHQDVSRYFMTIPEAVQLILKASLLPELSGHVAMLEMGDPVRIVDMAKNFLRLSGHPYRPGENVVFTGLRPGEKLNEELVAPDETVLQTDIDKVRLIMSGGDEGGVTSWLTEDEVGAMRAGDPTDVLRALRRRWPIDRMTKARAEVKRS